MTEENKNKKVAEEEVNEQVTEATQDTNSTTEEVAIEDADEKAKEAKPEKKEKKSSKKKKSDKSAAAQKDEEIEELGIKLSEISDKYMRLSAEFDNYRKRTLKEKTDLIKRAGGETLSSLLPIIDDFERGLQSMESAEDVVAVKEGVDLIYTKFTEFIKQKGITEIDALNTEFNTDLHEALTKIPAPSEELKGKVVDVIQKGYQIDEKVIRFAKVVIGE